MPKEPSTYDGIKPGKRSKLWLKVRKEWLLNNPPTHEGAYVCGICGRPVHYSQVEIDHIDGRGGDDISDMSNLQPSHRYCNQRKGSQKIKPVISQEEYRFRKEFDI